MSVALTGARMEDTLTGTTKGSMKCVIGVHYNNIPPQKNKLDILRSYPDLWQKFLVKLNSISFFTGMSIFLRDLWLELNQAYNDYSIGSEGSKFEIIQIGNKSLFTQKLDEDTINTLLTGNKKWTKDEIEGFFPSKPGSKARRHTLILLRSFWKIVVEYDIETKFEGNVIDIRKGILLSNQKVSEDKQIFIFDSIPLIYNKINGKWVSDVNKTQKLGFISHKSKVSKHDLSPLIKKS